MRKFIVNSLCLLALAAAYGCEDDPPKTGGPDPIEDPTLTALSLSIVGSTAALVPIALDGSESLDIPVSFTATVSGFKNAADAANLSLSLGPASGLTASSTGSVEGSRKTFVVTVQHDGQTKLSCTEASLTVNLSNIPTGYKYTEGPKSTSIAMRTGESENCRIPVNQANVLAFNRYANTRDGLRLHYELVENIVLPKPAPGQSNWTAIGRNRENPFAGSFDGRNHTLSGLEINRPTASFQGFFGSIGQDTSLGQNGEVANLGLIDASVVGNDYVGAVAGNISYSNSNSIDIFAVRNAYVKGNSRVSGLEDVGGVVGFTNIAVQNIYSEAEVEGAQHVGGVAGRIFRAVQNCYSTGNVSGNNYVGGVVGIAVNSTSSVVNCYATGEVLSRGASGGAYYTGGVMGHAHANIRDCLALNPKVFNANTPINANYIGRVGYVNPGPATRVYAFEGLLDGNDGMSSWPNKNPDHNNSGMSNGADLSAEALNDGSGIPNVFKSFPWTYAQGRLPGLFGETVEMPSHLSP